MSESLPLVQVCSFCSTPLAFRNHHHGSSRESLETYSYCPQCDGDDKPSPADGSTGTEPEPPPGSLSIPGAPGVFQPSAKDRFAFALERCGYLRVTDPGDWLASPCEMFVCTLELAEALDAFLLFWAQSPLEFRTRAFGCSPNLVEVLDRVAKAAVQP